MAADARPRELALLFRYIAEILYDYRLWMFGFVDIKRMTFFVICIRCWKEECYIEFHQSGNLSRKLMQPLTKKK